MIVESIGLFAQEAKVSALTRLSSVDEGVFFVKVAVTALNLFLLS
jgi:hypothetical protein